jgi:tRNA A37 threonylcarbamoyltransferase TsaD
MTTTTPTPPANPLLRFENAVQGVISKIVGFEKLVWADFVAFENWVASMAPVAGQALAELASLAQIAAPLAAANPGVSTALATVVTVADEANAVIHQVAAHHAIFHRSADDLSRRKPFFGLVTYDSGGV